jgi:hypothetical protein
MRPNFSSSPSSWNFALVLLGVAGLVVPACVDDSTIRPPGLTPDAGIVDAAPNEAAVVADATTEAQAEVDAEAGPPTPTGALSAVFQTRGDGDDDFAPFFTGDVAPPVAFDAAGNAYFGGSFVGSAVFGDPRKTTCTLIAKGGATDADAYVVKIDPAGNCAGAARIGGGTTRDTVRAIAIDPSGTVVAFGQLTSSTGAPSNAWSVNGGADTLTNNGAFLVGLGAGNLAFQFGQDMLPQSNATEPRGVAIGPGGVIAISGSVPGATSYPFMNSSGTVSSNGIGAYMGFVAQYQSNGQLSFAKVWASKTNNPSCLSTGGGLAYAANGDLVVSGRALGFAACDYVADSSKLGANPPADFVGAPMNGNGRTTLLVLRYDPRNGGAYKGGYAMPKTVSTAYARGMAMAPNGDIYALYDYDSPVGFPFGAETVPMASRRSGVVLRFDANLSELGHRVIQSPGGETSVSSVVVDRFGKVVIAGSAQGNVDFGDGKRLTFTGGLFDAFVAKLEPSLATTLWLNSYGSTGRDQGAGLAVSSTGTLAVHGSFNGVSLSLDGTRSIDNKDVSGTTYDGFGVILRP